MSHGRLPYLIGKRCNSTMMLDLHFFLPRMYNCLGLICWQRGKLATLTLINSSMEQKCHVPITKLILPKKFENMACKVLKLVTY